MLQFRTAILVLLATVGAAGCGGYAAPPAAPVPRPHGGTTLVLPEGLGYAELVNEPEVSGDRAKTPTSLVVYFLAPDGGSALSPLPSEVKASVELSLSRMKKQETLELASHPKSDDPVGSARFASMAGPYNLGVLRGEISGKLGTQTFKLTLAGGR